MRRRIIGAMVPIYLLTTRCIRGALIRGCFPIIVAALFARASPAPIPQISGGGNFTNGDTTSMQFKELVATGAKATRVSVYPQNYWNSTTSAATPQSIDAQMLRFHQYGINPIVILFEFYSTYTSPPRDRATWFSIGQGFATRWRPNSPFLVSQGISNWGITVYQAINEPDISQQITKTDYYNMLEGLCDGVHSVDSTLKVIPGGFMSMNAFSSSTLRGYGTAIAPLLNNGKLDGIDLHTYNDVTYAPIEKQTTPSNVGVVQGQYMFGFSPQSNFDAVKTGSGITRDINFYATEYGFKNNQQGITAPYQAKRLLTCIWANLGVVKGDGATAASGFALVWQLYSTVGQDSTYGLAQQTDPWIGTDAGKTFRMVMNLAAGMHFTSLDPRNKGEFVLEGAGKKMWVWQNLPAWTNHPDTAYMVTGIAATITKLNVYGWDSWNAPRKSISLVNTTSRTVTGLSRGETYMFVVDSANSTTLLPDRRPVRLSTRGATFERARCYGINGTKLTYPARTGAARGAALPGTGVVIMTSDHSLPAIRLLQK